MRFGENIENHLNYHFYILPSATKETEVRELLINLVLASRRIGVLKIMIIARRGVKNNLVSRSILIENAEMNEHQKS